jgi:hypothetical protein
MPRNSHAAPLLKLLATPISPCIEVVVFVSKKRNSVSPYKMHSTISDYELQKKIRAKEGTAC